tara:strand:+ start:1665 stop:2501 length:837 start_codon:yes stop_codon:yes gene_type:complete
MILKSFSKINLSLSINKKLKIGLHDIQSYFCLIDLYDVIKVDKIEGHRDIIKFKGKFSKYVNKKKNTISDTLSILRKHHVIRNHYSVIVHKKIPVFAGLGGGTSNAAYLTKHLSKKKINKVLFKNLEKKIGSDFKLFFYDQGLLRSIKKVEKFKKKHKLNFLLVYPNVKSSTKHVYSKVIKYSSKSKISLSKINNKKKFINLLLNTNNDLQLIVENKHPKIRELVKEINQKEGCYFSRMSGSGSVCYGLFESQKSANVALKKIKSKYSKFWFSVAKTI